MKGDKKNMKRNTKRLLALLMAFTVSFSMLSFDSYAAPVQPLPDTAEEIEQPADVEEEPSAEEEPAETQKPEIPSEEETPAVEPEEEEPVTAPAENPETAPETPAEDPEAPAEEPGTVPETPAENPGVTPESPAEEPGTVPETPAEDPEAPAEEPGEVLDTQEEEPQAVVEEPEEKEVETGTRQTFSDELIKKVIRKIILNSNGDVAVDISAYSVSADSMDGLVDEVLEETSLTDFADVTWNTNEFGYVTTVYVDMDSTMAAAFSQIDEIGVEEENSEAEETGSLYGISLLAEDGDTEEDAPKTLEDVKVHYAEYQAFKVQNADYFGIDVPYDTENDAKGPMGALVDMAVGIDPSLVPYLLSDDYVPGEGEQKLTADDLYLIIEMFLQGNAAGVQQLGDALLAAKDNALKHLTDDMSDVEKLLTLNEWLADWCEFSMENIMKDDDGNYIMLAPDSSEDKRFDEQMAPIYGLWQGNQFGGLVLRRCTCAGYTYAYSYLVQWAFPEIYQNANGTWKTKDEVNYTQETKTVTVDVMGSVPKYDEETGLITTAKVADSDGNPTDEWLIEYVTDDDGLLVEGKVPETEVKTVDGVEGLYVKKDESNNIVYKTETHDETENVFSTDNPYMVDHVKIHYDADVTMYGEPSNFNSVHYWNAVKVDGKWYYVDACYSDIYIECMARDRVETAGNMNHLYFMFSDTNCRKLYDGNFDKIYTLYEGVATDTTYEDAWFAFAKSPVTLYNGDWYYFYDSTDMIARVNQYGNMSGQSSSRASFDFGEEDTEYKLVVHKGMGNDADDSFTTLVDFNNGQAYNPTSGSMEDNQLIKDLYEKHLDYQEKYPSIQISGAVYEGLFYFNIANCILTYDLSTGEVVKLKEYNKVNAHRDQKVVMGGMAFSLVDDDYELDETYDFTVYNPPVASMCIDLDGNLRVSVATNYSFISGKASVDDTSGYGYEYEETNYNPDYSTYLANTGYSDETNDNDEFMWSANVVEKIAMSTLTGEHTYAAVTVAPFCGEDGYTEERCTECGAIKADTREVNEGTAEDHHYVKFDEQYYTKDSSGNWNTGTAYICTICKDSQDEAPETYGHIYTAASEEAVTWTETQATVTSLVCATCGDKSLDCVVNDASVRLEDVNVVCDITDTKVTGECATGLTTVYTAVGTTESGAKVVVEKTEVGEPGIHNYEGTFTWAEDYSSATADLKCTICGDEQKGVECTVTSETTEADCENDGKTVYTAVAKVVQDDKEVGSAADTKEVIHEKLGHDYGEPAWGQWTAKEDGGYTVDATFTCARDNSHVETVTVEGTPKETNATCTEAGNTTYEATVKVPGGDKEYTNPEKKVVAGEPLGHSYKAAAWNWAKDYSSATVNVECIRGDVKETVKADVTSKKTDATCTSKGQTVYTATVSYHGQTFTDTKTVEIPAKGHNYVNGVCTVCGATTILDPGTPVVSETGSTYTVTSSGSEGGTVTFAAPASEAASVVIPDTVNVSGTVYQVTAIADGAFSGNTKLESVVIGNNVAKVPEKAFYKCTALKSVKFGDKTKTIGSYAFAKCTSLTTIAIKKTVTSIESYAFTGCSKLKTVTGCSSVTKIGTNAFANDGALTTVKGCTKVDTIGSKAFYKCAKLTTLGNSNNAITLPKVKTINPHAFYGCKAIKKVNSSSTVLTKIGDSAFQSCTAMTSFTSKSTKLTTIGKNAFNGDKKLATISLKTSSLKKAKVGSNAFKNVKSTCTFKVPSKKVSSYKEIFKAKGAGSKFKVKKL